MRSPATAFAWEFRHRHRWGWAALACHLAVLAMLRLLVIEPGQRVTFAESWHFALAVIVPLAASFTYLLAVFSFGLESELDARKSIYPARKLTLPVSNAALAGWPTLYGAAVTSVLWLLTRALAPWPAGAEVPWIWPALFAAVMLAWTQALVWMPYPWRGLRVILVVLWLSVVGFVVVLALHLRASELAMLILLAPQLPAAHFVARFAVARARHGGHAAVRRPRLPSRRREPWPSPTRAQAWLEWRRHGRGLPILVGFVLPFELALIFVFKDAPSLVLATLAAVLLTPPFLATFVAATVSRSSPNGSDFHELTPFLATRPLDTAALLAAKLEATIRSTSMTWLLVLTAMALAVGLSGTSPVLADAVRRLVEMVGTPRAIGLGLLALAALVIATWKQLVHNLYIGLSGRAWLIKASVFASLAFLTLLVPLVLWALERKNVILALWNALPTLLAILACCKIAVAFWSAGRLLDSGLLSERALVVGALAWCAVVLALYGLLAWLLPTLIFPAHLLALVAILAVPLARLAAAPLALSWNRHR